MALQSARIIIGFCLLCGVVTPLYSQNSFASSAHHKSVAAGGAHAVVIAADGTMWAWGYNGQGQLNQKNLSHITSPVKIAAPFTAVSVATGFKHSLALDSDGNVWTWGDNDTTTWQVVISNIAQIAMGPSDDALLLDETSNVWQFASQSQKPIPIKNLEDVAGIGVGLSSFFAFKYDCSLMAWGKNNFGQLGIDTQETIRTPLPASLFSCLSAISADNHTVALDADGRLWTWGYNREGQLGNGSTKSQPAPEQLNSLTNISAIDTNSHTLALKSDGSVWAWGENNYGQLGDGSTTDQTTPVEVAGLRQVAAIAAGAMFSVAVKSDGSVWAWGRNNYGQLGNGTQKNSSVPVQVLGYEGDTFLNLNASSVDDEIPPIYFTADPAKGNAPLKVTFKPVHSPNYTYKSVEWDFGDGDISGLDAPVHIYETPGSYIVTLTTRYPGDIYRESMKQIVVKTSW